MADSGRFGEWSGDWCAGVVRADRAGPTGPSRPGRADRAGPMPALAGGFSSSIYLKASASAAGPPDDLSRAGFEGRRI